MKRVPQELESLIKHFWLFVLCPNGLLLFTFVGHQIGRIGSIRVVNDVCLLRRSSHRSAHRVTAFARITDSAVDFITLLDSPGGNVQHKQLSYTIAAFVVELTSIRKVLGAVDAATKEAALAGVIDVQSDTRPQLTRVGVTRAMKQLLLVSVAAVVGFHAKSLRFVLMMM